MPEPKPTLSPVVVPRAVAEGLTKLREDGMTNADIYVHVAISDYTFDVAMPAARYFQNDPDKLMTALVVGYIIERSPEERVKDYYDQLQADARRAHEATEYESVKYYLSEIKGITQTLDLLGIPIKDVNA